MPRPTARPRLDKKNSQWLPQLSRSCDIFNDTITAAQDTDLANTSKIQAKIMRVKHVCTNDQHCLDLRKYKDIGYYLKDGKILSTKLLNDPLTVRVKHCTYLDQICKDRLVLGQLNFKS